MFWRTESKSTEKNHADLKLEWSLYIKYYNNEAENVF